MDYKTSEQLLEGFKTDLQDNMSAFLAAINALHTVTVETPVPNVHNYYIANSVDTVPELSNLPAVILMAWNETPVLEGEQGWDFWMVDCAVRMWTSGYDQEKLTRAVYRYAAALVCIVNDKFPARGVDISGVRADYSSISPTEPLYQAVEVSFNAKFCRSYVL